MRFPFVFPIFAVVVSACGEPQSSDVVGMNDALAREACSEAAHPGERIHSVLETEDAVGQALVHAGRPVTVELVGPTSYVAVEIPNHHADYAIFTQPAEVLEGTSTTNLPQEALNGACVNARMGDNRLHVHEFDHSVLTLRGSGTVWLYFAQDGQPGHGGAGGVAGHHGEGGTGGTGHHD